jgi:DNA-binding XRE family transcriptional regulator
MIYAIVSITPSSLNEVGKLGYRSKAARLGAAMGADLFSLSSEEKVMRLPDDSQACIRSALRRRRRTLGLTQEDAASLLGMSRVTYHRIETGVRRIRFVEIAAICEAFNCHVGELVQDGQLASAYVHAAKAILGEASP